MGFKRVPCRQQEGDSESVHHNTHHFRFDENCHTYNESTHRDRE